LIRRQTEISQGDNIIIRTINHTHTQYSSSSFIYLNMPSRPRSLTPTRRSTPLRSRKSLTPTRRSARIRTRNSVDLASATPEEMALRILLLEEKYEDITEQMQNLSTQPGDQSKTTPNNIESFLPEVTVQLLTEGMESKYDEVIQFRNQTDALRQDLTSVMSLKEEVKCMRNDLVEALSGLDDAKLLLRNASEDKNLSMRREQELIARIDHLTNQNQDLLEYQKKNHQLELEVDHLTNQNLEHQQKNQRVELEKETLEEELTTLMEEKDSLELKFDKLVGEYDKSVQMLEPIFTSKCTPVKGKETIEG